MADARGRHVYGYSRLVVASAVQRKLIVNKQKSWQGLFMAILLGNNGELLLEAPIFIILKEILKICVVLPPCFSKKFRILLCIQVNRHKSLSRVNRLVGWVKHPNWQKKYELQKNTLLFELNLEYLLPQTIHQTKELSKFPPVRRDIAIIVENSISVHALLTAMHAEKSPTVFDITLFDIYRGKGMDNNKKSLAFRILLQDTEKTLTDSEVDSEVLKLIKVLENKFSATLRNG